MILTRTQRIVSRGLTLDERLVLGVSGAGEEPVGEAALVPWCKAYAGCNRELFARRLEWDALSPDQVARALGAQATPEALPSWAGNVEASIEAARALAGALETGLEEEGLFEGEDPPPFLHAVIPFARVVRERLRPVLESDGMLSRDAIQSLHRYTIRDLASVAAQALYVEFDGFRRTRAIEGASLAGDELYREFVHALYAGGYETFFETYSGLARLLGRSMELAIETFGEFATRLRSDLEAIRALCRLSNSPSVVRLGLGRSDRHLGGRQVIDVGFEGGGRVIYKPRDQKLTGVWSQLMAWSHERGFDLVPPGPVVIEREGYGWVEFVPQTPARNAKAVERYFSRAGALLAYAYLFRARDLHMENVIAGPRGPVIIDLEALMQPEVAVEQGSGTFDLAQGMLHESVLDTGLLSFPEMAPDGGVHDVGGLRGRGGHMGSVAVRWRAVNTDAMLMQNEARMSPPHANVLYLGGVAQRPEDYASAIVEGFEKAYRFVCANREELLSVDGPLAAFSRARVRLIFRPSSLYGFVIQKLRTPAWQRTADSMSFLADSINRVFHSETLRPSLWALVREERHALEDLDIPLFFIEAGASEVRTARGETVSGHWTRSGIESVRSRIAAAGDGDLDRQLQYLWSSLLPADDAAIQQAADVVPVAAAPLRDSAVDDALDAIVQRIFDEAIRGDDGIATWMSTASVRVTEASDPAALYYIYDGGPGITVFLAALASRRQDSKAADLATAGARAMTRLIDSEDASRLFSRAPLGVCNGVGSLIYALTVTGTLLEDASLLEAALRASALVSDERIDSDLRLDVEGGSAGAILSLIELHERTGEQWLIERAERCATHLVARAKVPVHGGIAWPDPNGVLLAGMAHGTAGYALAFSRLAAVTGDGRWRAIAMAAMAYERTLLDRERRNWPVLASDGSRSFMQAWCHGAPGILISRIGCRKAGATVFADQQVRERSESERRRPTAAVPLDSGRPTFTAESDEISQDIEIAIESVLRSGLSPVDHVCCGNFGRIEALLVAAEALSRKDLLEAARERAATVLERSVRDKGFALRLAPSERRWFVPGFFRGTAGIGYTLLRLTEPAGLPSILSFSSRPGVPGPVEVSS